MDWSNIISILLNLLLGGGLILSLVTLKAKKRQEEASADQIAAGAKQTLASATTTEIGNVSEIADKWRQFAEESELRYSSMNKLMQQQITSLQADVTKLSKQLNQILKIIKEINHDNLDQKKQEASDIARE